MPRTERWGEETSLRMYEETIGGVEFVTRSFATMAGPFEEYRAIPKMNASTLVHGLKSMRRLKRFIDGAIVEETACMAVGTAFHCAILEPERFLDQYAVMPDFAKDSDNVTDKGVPSASSATKYVKQKQHEWRCRFGDKIEIDEVDYKACQEVIQSISQSEYIVSMLKACEHEKTLEGSICGVECKGRVDFIGDVLGDLKTTQSVDVKSFSRVFFNLEYGFKLAFYRELARQNGFDVPVVVLAVETSGDYDKCLYRIPDVLLDSGFENVKLVLTNYLRCKETGHWPGVDCGFDAIDFPVPAYMLKEEFDWSVVESKEVETEDIRVCF